jgi:hypothetical protein
VVVVVDGLVEVVVDTQAAITTAEVVGLDILHMTQQLDLSPIII